MFDTLTMQDVTLEALKKRVTKKINEWYSTTWPISKISEWIYIITLIYK